MKTIPCHGVLLGALLAVAQPAAAAAEAGVAPSPADLVMSCHFAGVTSLLTDTNAATLKRIWLLPDTEGLRKQFWDQAAGLPYLSVSNTVGREASNQAALFRPLLEDVLPNESFLEWRAPAGRTAEFVLALQLGEERARLWDANLRQALEQWKLGAISEAKTEGSQGWALQHRDGQHAFGYARAGQWVVVALGPQGLPLQAQMLRRIKTDGRPGAKATPHWLVADLNLEKLKPWLPPLASYAHPPLAHLVVSNRADRVVTSAEFRFPQGHGWKGEPWSVPTSLIRAPLCSFSAARGIAPLTQAWSWLRGLPFEPPPNQVCFWASSLIPFQSHLALPLKEGGPQLARLTPALEKLVSTNKTVVRPASVGWDTNMHALVWRGLPVAMPELAELKTREGDFLVGGLFPRQGGTNLPPKQLYQQLQGRPELAYYDWEITEMRLRQWRALYQLLDLGTGRPIVSTNAPSQRWVMAVAPLLGEAVTEVTAPSPTQLNLVRKSYAGFTGFELLSFLRWMDSPDYPRLSVMGHERRVRPVTKSTKPAPPARLKTR